LQMKTSIPPACLLAPPTSSNSEEYAANRLADGLPVRRRV
jgi:hypothetical protein